MLQFINTQLALPETVTYKTYFVNEMSEINTVCKTTSQFYVLCDNLIMSAPGHDLPFIFKTPPHLIQFIMAFTNKVI